MPEKLTYTEGDELDTTGLLVNVLYSNGEKVPTTDYTLSGFESVEGTYDIVIAYGDFTASFSVTVEKPQPLYILGDSDSNGKVNVSDATQIQLYLASKGDPSLNIGTTVTE